MAALRVRFSFLYPQSLQLFRITRFVGLMI